MVLSEEGRDWFGLCLIPLSYPVSLASLVFPMLAVCTLWNANNPWISLANPFAAASSATHPCTHWLSPSQRGPWPQGALGQYEPVTALFEQLGRVLYWPVAARDLFLWGNNHLGAFTFLCLQEPRTWRWGNASNSCGLCCYRESFALMNHSWISEYQEKTECLWSRVLKNLPYFGDWRASFTGDIQENGFRLCSIEPLGTFIAVLPAKQMPLFQRSFEKKPPTSALMFCWVKVSGCEHPPGQCCIGFLF